MSRKTQISAFCLTADSSRKKIISVPILGSALNSSIVWNVLQEARIGWVKMFPKWLNKYKHWAIFITYFKWSCCFHWLCYVEPLQLQALHAGFLWSIFYLPLPLLPVVVIIKTMNNHRTTVERGCFVKTPNTFGVTSAIAIDRKLLLKISFSVEYKLNNFFIS